MLAISNCRPLLVGSCLPIVTSGSGGNAKNSGVEVELAKTGVFPPVDLLELGSVLLRLGESLSLRLLVENAHVVC